MRNKKYKERVNVVKIYNITDKEYEAYGRVLTKDYQVDALIKEMEKTPAPDHVIYIPSDDGLEGLDQAKVLQESFFGGLPIQVGYCNGTNHKLDACEYHRCSELGVAITDLILLLGKQQDVTLEHYYDTDNIQAFFVPAGTVYEMYATTLHYAPCSVEGKPFKNIVILPKGTNADLAKKPQGADEDPLLFAENKWLIAHEEAGIEGAFNGLKGLNISVD